MATIITCDNIEQEADRLLQLFRSCYTLTGTDMDDLVNLAYSASLCGTGEGSIPTFNQNNLFTYKFTNSGLILEADPVVAINTSTAFTVDEKELLIYRHVYYEANGTYTASLKEDHYLHMAGKGSFGVAGTALTISNLYLLKSDVNSDIPTTPGTTLAPRVLSLYANDVGGATISTPHTILNGSTDLVTITNTQDTYFTVYDEQFVTANPAWNLYRFTGAAGSYGTGVDTAIIGDFTLVEAFDGLPSTGQPNGQIKIREIAVPIIIDGTTITDIADAVNSGYVGLLNVEPNEIVLFIADFLEPSITLGDDTLNLLTQKWAWNQGAQASINGSSVLSDYTLISTIKTTSVVSAGSPSNPAALYYTQYDVIDSVTDAVDAANALTGADRIVLNSNLVLFKTTLDDGSKNSKIWEFTGAVTGNGTYGVSGLTAVAGDFESTPVIDSTVEPTTALTAADILWDDTVSTLGQTTVQGAIDDLAALITAISTGSSFYEVGGVLPAYDPTADIHRTGRLGLGTITAPSELIHLAMTEAGAKGGIKSQYTNTSGAVTRFQSGGQALYSELGESAGTVEGFNHEFFANTTDYVDDMRAFTRGGDYLVAGGTAKNFGFTSGIISETVDRHAIFDAYPLTSDSDIDWVAEVSALNEDSDAATVTVSSKGTGSGYALESSIVLSATNTVNTSSFTMTPHISELTDLFSLTSYGVGTFVTGYTHTDTAAATGTTETTIGALVNHLGVDANGVLLETTPYFTVATPAAGLGPRYDLADTDVDGFYFGRSVDGRPGYNVWNTNTGTSATAGYAASRSSSPYTNTVSLQYFGINYFGTPLQDKGGLYADTNMVFVGANAANFEWYGVPGTALGSMSGTPIMDLDTNGILRLQQTSTDEIDSSGNGDEVTTVDWTALRIQRADVTVTAAQVKAWGSTPITLVPALGANITAVPVQIVYTTTYVSAAFDSTVAVVRYNGGSTIDNGFNVSFTADQNTTGSAIGVLAMSANTAIEVGGTDSVATGDSDVRITVYYRVK